MRIDLPISILAAVLLCALAACAVQAASAAETYRFVSAWGSYGEINGKFNVPYGIACDGAGHVYVTDRKNARVQEFTTNGTFIRAWGGVGYSNGKFHYPTGIAIDTAGNVYVADEYDDLIQKFTSSGTFVRAWGTSGTANGQFSHPQGVAVDAAGNVYVADKDNDRVQVFDTSGTHRKTWSGISKPFDIAVNTAGTRVYVIASLKVLVFDAGGNQVGSWGSYGTGNGQFDYPKGIAVDSLGNVFVTDFGNSRVQKFTSTGAFITKWGSFGRNLGQFIYPMGVDLDRSGYVYVVDGNYALYGTISGNDCIQKFIGPVSAEFSGRPTSGLAPLTVQFTDASQGEPTGWNWTFGDGATSNETSPSHTYRLAGTYSVSLAVTDVTGTDTETKTAYVNVSAPPTPAPDRGYFKVWTVPIGAAVYLEDDSGRRTLQGFTGSGPLIVTVFLDRTPMKKIIANLSGYYDAVYTIEQYPSKGETVPVVLLLEPVDDISQRLPPPRDLDGDGRYEDVNGNGQKDFEDVVLYFNQMSRIAATEPIVAFDYNGNGHIDFADVVWLFNNL